MQGYREVEGSDAEKVYLRCCCGQIIKKRRDSYAPGTHTVVCLVCHNCSSEVSQLDASVSAGQPSA